MIMKVIQAAKLVTASPRLGFSQVSDRGLIVNKVDMHVHGFTTFLLLYGSVIMPLD